MNVSRGPVSAPLPLVLLLLLTACGIGPRLQDLEWAHSPGGTRTTIRLSDAEFRNAELLIADDSAVVILSSDDELVRVHYSAIYRIHMADRRSAVLRGRAPRPEVLSEWRAISRFPQGLTPSQMAQLVSHHGGSGVKVLR